ncbi:MAG: hypothetical protein QOF56_794, partial [Acidobacteriaceae bacterium]|nr:hypothetical protein [Acidobacteriaceae bacterium]
SHRATFVEIQFPDVRPLVLSAEVQVESSARVERTAHGTASTQNLYGPYDAIQNSIRHFYCRHFSDGRSRNRLIAGDSVCSAFRATHLGPRAPTRLPLGFAEMCLAGLLEPYTIHLVRLVEPIPLRGMAPAAASPRAPARARTRREKEYVFEQS